MNLSLNNWLTLILSILIICSIMLVIYIIANIKKRILERNGNPYLIRWTIFKCKWGSLKVHKALVSDSADPHDHPWNYLSIILWGGYFEEQTRAVKYFSAPNTIQDNITVKKWYSPGRVLYRRGDKLHRLIIPEGKPCITLIFTFKKWRDWGFLKGNRWHSYKDGVTY